MPMMPTIESFETDEYREWGETYLDLEHEDFLQVLVVRYEDKPGKNYMEIQCVYHDGDIGYVRFRLAKYKTRMLIAEELRAARLRVAERDRMSA